MGTESEGHMKCPFPRSVVWPLTSRWVDEQSSEQQLHVAVAKVKGHHLGNNSRVSMLALYGYMSMLTLWCYQYVSMK